LDISKESEFPDKDPEVFMLESASQGGVCVVTVKLWGHLVPCLLDTGGGVDLLGQAALRYAPKDLMLEPLPRSFHVHGANGQDVHLTGTAKVPFTFTATQEVQPVIAKFAIAPEFKGGLLLSKSSMMSIGITIELRHPRCVIHLRRWNLALQEDAAPSKPEAAWVSQLKASVVTDSHKLAASSGAQRICSELQASPVIIPAAKADEFLRKWRTQQEPSRKLIVTPLLERKLHWQVLRDVMVTVPRLLDPSHVSPQMGPCVMVWISSERQARHFRVSLAARVSAATTKGIVDRMVALCGDGTTLRDRAVTILDELVDFGIMDTLPRTRFEETGEWDPEDDRKEIYVPKPQKPLHVDLEQRIRAIRIGALPDEQLKAVKSLLEEFKVIFRDPSPGTVSRTVVEHKIAFRSDGFISARPYRLGPPQEAALREHVQHLLKLRMVRPSSSPYSSPIFAIPKKDETGKITDTRWVMDYRAVNEKTIPDRYPIPNIEDLLSKVAKARVFSKIDLKSSYWQIMIARRDQAKTAFVTPFELSNGWSCRLDCPTRLQIFSA